MKKLKMQSQNEYIGDDKMQKMLQHYLCPLPLDTVKMRFAGAICSPNLELRPSDVISSLWPQNQEPRLQTKEEAELFFKFFMGLWDHIFNLVRQNAVCLPARRAENSRDDWAELCFSRAETLEQGYIEGFWGGRNDLKIPAYLAELIDSLSDLAALYLKLAERLQQEQNIENLVATVKNTDKMVNRSIAFIIENTVLPRMAQPQTQN